MHMLEQAISLASRVHQGQVDKQGAPYILHPLRVMLALRKAGHDVTTQIVGVLHDVVEDTEISLTYIEASYDETIAEWLDAVTHRGGESYFDYIRRVIEAGPVAIQVKSMDLRDNLGTLDPGRGYPKPSLAQRYYKALDMITGRRY